MIDGFVPVSTPAMAVLNLWMSFRVIEMDFWHAMKYFGYFSEWFRVQQSNKSFHGHSIIYNLLSTSFPKQHGIKSLHTIVLDLDQSVSNESLHCTPQLKMSVPSSATAASAGTWLPQLQPLYSLDIICRLLTNKLLFKQYFVNDWGFPSILQSCHSTSQFMDVIRSSITQPMELRATAIEDLPTHFPTSSSSFSPQELLSMTELCAEPRWDAWTRTPADSEASYILPLQSF